MKKHFVLGLIFTIMAVLLSACGSSMDPSDAYRGESGHTIFVKGKKALLDNNYSEAAKRFEALDVQYPNAPETEQAQLYLIYAYYMKEDYTFAVAAADRFIRMHPTSPHVDYAYYMRGIANYYQNIGVLERIFTVDLATRDLSQIRKSYYDFNELISRFPNSYYAASSYQYMIYLRNVLADHEYQVGQYYYDRKAYQAAANRASELVAHYQGAPATVPGLVLMAKSYHQMGLTKLEKDTLRVLYYNYPDAKVLY